MFETRHSAEDAVARPSVDICRPLSNRVGSNIYWMHAQYIQRVRASVACTAGGDACQGDWGAVSDCMVDGRCGAN